jgi:putative transposase
VPNRAYRQITALLNEAGWNVSVSRVARIWWREGLKVPGKQGKRCAGHTLTAALA